MHEPTMLYRAPGPHKLHGHDVDYTIVDASEVEDHIAAGWFKSPAEAAEAKAAAERAEAERKEAEADDSRAATREEGVQWLEANNIVFDRRLGDKKLFALVEEKRRAMAEGAGG